MELGRQIRKYRSEMQLSQEELAEKIFVSRQTISNWENDKSYPDIRSLVLLSEIFGVSLDNLVKGDIEKMKEQINSEDLTKFEKNSKTFAILLAVTILLPIPLTYFFGFVGIGIWFVLFIMGMYFAVQVEKQKKSFNIQTYKEITAFTEGKSLNEIEKAREYGKRPYQKVLLVICAGAVAFLVTSIMDYILKSFAGV